MSDVPPIDVPDPVAANSPETEPQFREVTENNEVHDEDLRYRLGTLVVDSDGILAEHQVEALDDVFDFFREGRGTMCYVLSPTGSGKTPELVKVVDKFLETFTVDEYPKAIVVTSSKSLVDQTVGMMNEETGKRKGFKGFAPHLDARAYHSDVPQKIRLQNIQEADVIVTTYSMFRNLVAYFSEAELKTPADWQEMQQELQAQVPELKRQMEAVGLERHWLTRELFQQQEVDRALKTATRLLKYQELYRITGKQARNLEKVVAISSAEDTTNQEKIEALRLQISRMDTNRTTDARNKFAQGLSQARATRRMNQLEEAESKANSPDNQDDKVALSMNDQASIEPAEQLDEVDVMNAPHFKSLTEYESFVMWFGWHNRRNKTIKVEDLRARKDRLRVYVETERIRDLRSRMHYLDNQIKQAIQNEEFSKIAGTFKIMICDEVHRVLGTKTWEAMEEYTIRRKIPVVGFTATDFYKDRHLADYFDGKAHELTRQEAMRREIINPVATFVHYTGLRFGGVGIDASGDYDKMTMREMRFSEERNQLGVDYARIAAEAGYQGIMSAIPGDKGAHAKVLAEKINQTLMLDPATGEERYMRAAYVLQSTKDRKKYDDALEAGELDFLVFVDVLREGWDSDAAKVLINMRPTLSLLLAIQRLGRVCRLGDQISMVFDLYDNVEGIDALNKLPPVVAVDAYDLDNIKQGHIIGGEGLELSPPLLRAILEKTGDKPIRAFHTTYSRELGKIVMVDAVGRSIAEANAGDRHAWQTLEAIQHSANGFMSKELLDEATSANPPLVRLARGRRGKTVVQLYNTDDIRKLHQDKAEINPWKLHVDENGERWITPEGCITLLSKRFPNLKGETITSAISEIETQTNMPFTKNVGRVRLFDTERNERTGLVYMYKMNEIIDRLVPHLTED